MTGSDGAPDLRLDTAEAADVPALYALERRCHTHPWTLRHFADAVADRATMAVLVLRRESAGPETLPSLAGFSVLQLVAGEMHLHNLAVDVPERRRGLGRRLLEASLAWGARMGAAEVFLEVRRSNWAALELYRNAGFEAVGVRRDYYEQPREDALLLRLKGPLQNP